MSDFYQSGILSGEYKPASQNPREKAQTPAKLLISAAVFGALFALLFTRQSAGLNVTVTVLLIYAFAVLNSELFMKRSFREEKLITFFSLPVVFLALNVFISSTFLNVLSILVILFVIFVQYMVLSGNALYRWYQPMFLVDLVLGGINRLFMGMGQFAAGSVNGIFKKQSENKKGAVIGVLVGIALLILIVPMLLMADPVVSAAVNLFFAQINFGDAFLYIFMFILGASAVMAPIATACRGEYTGIRTARDYSALRPVQGVTTGVALSIISVVYILFGAVQFSYFFFPRETITKILGLTSSAYAVSGFGELLFITCLNFIIIGLSLRFTKQKEGKTQGYLKVLLTILIAFNFIIMASSHMRLEYYESSFGYTVARFISHSFMILLAILNVIMLIKIYVGKVKAIKLFATAALIYFCCMVAVNPELCVVRSNIERYKDKKEIDAAYMFTLSGDAVSEACGFFEENPGLFDEDARQTAISTYKYYQHQQTHGWQSLNLAGRNAYRKLQDLL